MLFCWLLTSAFRAQPGRWLIAGLTVALGIGLAVAIHTVNRSALSEFGRALDTVNGQASASEKSPDVETSCAEACPLTVSNARPNSLKAERLTV